MLCHAYKYIPGTTVVVRRDELPRQTTRDGRFVLQYSPFCLSYYDGEITMKGL